MKRFPLLLFLLMAASLGGRAQSEDYARWLIDSLCSPSFFGRGYAFEGDAKAASFLAGQMRAHGLRPLAPDYLQPFWLPVNIHEGAMSVKADGRTLSPGEDYLVGPSSPSLEGRFKTRLVGPRQWDSPRRTRRLARQDHSGRVLLLDTAGMERQAGTLALFQQVWEQNAWGAKAVAVLTDRGLTHSVSHKVDAFARVSLRRAALPKPPRHLELDIDSRFAERYRSQNVVGVLPGAIDSFIVFTAHYDHLGGMGASTYFPGAHDNASGTATVVDLARHLASLPEPPRYSVAFLLFGAEEIGLVGSGHFVENPLLPLDRVRFLFNLDLLGSGDQGATLVNATEHPADFALLDSLNRQGQYLPQLGRRGPAANSDHYFFHLSGVPSFFLYTQGQYTEYHNIRDRAEGLPLPKYDELFRLALDFAYALMGQQP